MALKLSLPTVYGVNAEYWKICQLNINTLDHQAHADLLGFISAEARADYPNSRPIASRSFDWPPGDLQFAHEGVNNFEIAYEQIKTWHTFDAEGNPIPAEFTNAEDC